MGTITAEPIPSKEKKKLEMASGEVGKDLKNDYWPMVNIDSSDVYKRQPWMCEVCEQQPAVFTCKADAAVLCLSCDSQVHSTNTLASRHQRVPITESIFPCSTTTNNNSGNSNSTNFLFKWSDDDESEDRVEGFPLWHPPPQSNKLKEGMVMMTDVVEQNDMSSTNLFSDVEKFLDLDYAPSSSMYLGFQHNNQHQHQHQNQQSRLFPVNNNVVSKSHGMIVVPEEKKAKEDIHETETAAMVPVVAVGIDREARVMRYREKRKNRKFEKTIRYASRKAYAESRPRVKGRFVKREDNNDDDDAPVMVVGGGNFYSSSSSSAGNMLALDSGYGMVPSF